MVISQKPQIEGLAENIMTNRKESTGRSLIYKTLQRIIKIDQHKAHKNGRNHMQVFRITFNGDILY